MPARITDSNGLSWSATIDDSDLNKIATKIEQRLGKMSDSAVREGERMGNMFSGLAKAAAAFFTAQQASQLIGAIVRVRGEFQQLEIAFTTMLGSKEKADRLMAEAVELAAKTPFGLSDVAAGAKQLLAYGFAADEITDNITRLGNVASGVGSQIGDLIYLYGTLKASGRVTQMDINQFAGRGVPIYAELAKVLQTNVEQVRDFVSAGKVGFADIEKAFQNMTNQGGMFYNLMEAQSASLTGRISNLQDTVENMFNEIGRSNEGVFNNAIEAATFLVENYEEIGKILGVLVTTYGAYRTAIILTTAAEKGYTIAQILQYRWLVIVEKAQKLLNATMLANPYVAAATAITAIVSTLVLFNDEAANAEKVQQNLNQALNDGKAQVIDQKVKIDDLIAAIKDENTTNEVRTQKLNELHRITDGRLSQLTIEKIRTGEATAAIDEYVAALDREARAKAYQETKIKNLQRLQEIDLAKKQKLSFGEYLKYQLLAGPGYSAQGYRDNQLDAEAKALSDQNKSIDEQTKVSLETAASRNKTSQQVAVQNKEYWEGQKKQAQDAYDALDEVGRKSAQGQALAKQILEADKKIGAYNVVGQNKAAGKASAKAVSDLKKDQDRAVQAREQFILQLAGVDKEFTDQVRLDRYEDEAKAVEHIRIRFEELRAEAKKVGADSKETMLYLQNLESEQIAYVRDQAAKDKSTEAANKKAEEQKQAYQGMLQSAQDYYTQVASLQKEYQNAIGGLKAQKLDPKEEARQMRIIQDFYGKILKQLNLDGSEIFKKIAPDYVATLSKEQINAVANELEKIIESGQMKDATGKMVDVPPEVLLRIKDAKDQLKGIVQEVIALEVSSSKLGKVASTLMTVGDGIADIGDTLSGIDSGSELGGILSTMGQFVYDIGNTYTSISKAIKSAKSIITAGKDVVKNLLESNDIWGAILAIVNIVVDMIGMGKKYKQELAELQRTVQEQNVDIYLAQYRITESQREQNRLQAESIELTYEQIAARRELLKSQKDEINNEAARLLQELNNSGEYVRDRGVKGKTWFLGKPKAYTEYAELSAFSTSMIEEAINSLEYLKGSTTQDLLQELRQKFPDGSIVNMGDVQEWLQSTDFDELQGRGTGKSVADNIVDYLSALADAGNGIAFTYEELTKLYEEGRLEGATLKMYEQLKSLVDQGADVNQALKDLEAQTKEIFTATTSDNIVDAIVEGFRNGKKSAADFADSFEDLMRSAMLNSLKYKYLEAPIQDFYEKFAAEAQDNGGLDADEIAYLRNLYKSIWDGATEQLQNLEDITGISANTPDSKNNNSLSGALASASQESIDLLAGHTMGMRVAQLKTNDLLEFGFADSLEVANRSLDNLVKIERNTYMTVTELKTLNSKISSVGDIKRAGGNG